VIHLINCVINILLIEDQKDGRYEFFMVCWIRRQPIFVSYTLNANNQVITRDRFLLELSMALIKPYLIKLLSRSNLHILVQCSLKSFLDEQDLPEEDPRNLRLNISKNATGYLCPTKKENIRD